MAEELSRWIWVLGCLAGVPPSFERGLALVLVDFECAWVEVTTDTAVGVGGGTGGWEGPQWVDGSQGESDWEWEWPGWHCQ